MSVVPQPRPPRPQPQDPSPAAKTKKKMPASEYGDDLEGCSKVAGSESGEHTTVSIPTSQLEGSISTTTTHHGTSKGNSTSNEAASLNESSSNRNNATHSPGPRSQSRSRALLDPTANLVLFDLTLSPTSTLTFSPHCVKSIIDFKILGLTFDRQRLSFWQVRNDLEKRLGRSGVTVPSLELEDGRAIVGSWEIAEYLELHHPRGSLLFPNTSSKHLSHLIHSLAPILSPFLRPLVIPALADLLHSDARSREYFIERKVGRTQWERAVRLTEEDKWNSVTEARRVLEVVEVTLSTFPAVIDSTTTSSAPTTNTSKTTSTTTTTSLPCKPLFLAGTPAPTHADACLYGWYVYTRLAGPRWTREVWHHHENLAEWVQRMDTWCGEEITKNFA